MEIVEYHDEDYNKWNEFVKNNSVNGTFLQTKQFLDYHPRERFQDASLLFLNKGNIVAVCPACCITEDGKKVFSSHKGSTYGGLVISPKFYKTEKLLELISDLEQYLYDKQYKKIELKITPDILSMESSELYQFCLQYRGYSQKVFLNTYVDLNYYKDDILSNFEQGKRTNVHNCLKEKLYLEQIDSKKQIEEFYGLLCHTLGKYGQKPVHTVNELMRLKDERLKDEVKVYGIFKENEMLAGAMIFYFEKAMCAHTQYLAAKAGYEKLSPMTFTYYSVIEMVKKMGYRYVSWGISTEHDGTINYGLTRSKEAYGSFHSLNRIFEKELS